MVDLVEIKKNRFLYLKKLYQASNANSKIPFDMFEVGEELGYDYDLTSNIVNYLINEGLVEAYAMGGAINLSHMGLREVEQALEYPKEPTEHFAPIINYNITTSGDGSIVNTGNGNTISISNTFEKEKIIAKAKQILEVIENDNSLNSQEKIEARGVFNDLIIEVNKNQPSNSILEKVMLYGASVASIGSLVVGIIQLLSSKI